MAKSSKPVSRLEAVARAVRSRNSPSYELSQLFRRKRDTAAVLAEALLTNALELDLRARAGAYHWLAQSPQRETLPSTAVFEHGLTDRSKNVQSACRAVLGGDVAADAVKARRTGAVAETARGASGDPARFDSLREYLGPRFPAIVAFDELAVAMGIDEDQVRAEVAAMVEGWLATPKPPSGSPVVRPYLHTTGARYGTTDDPFHTMLVPDPFELEVLVNAGRYAELDARLRTKMKAPALSFSPSLRWRDGSALSAGALSWVTASLFARQFYKEHVPTDGARNGARPVPGGADVIAAALDPEDLRELVVQAALSKTSNSVVVRIPLTEREAIANALGSLAAHRTLKRPLDSIQPFGTSRAGIRWLARLGRPVSDEDLEAAFPEGDDLSGSQALWEALVARTLEHALVTRRSIPTAHFMRCYLKNPLARRAIAGVVLEAGDARLRVHETGPLELEGKLVRIAHPADGTEGWPEGEDGRIVQRSRRIFHEADLPAWPPPPIPNRAYLTRVRATGMRSEPEVLGGTVSAYLGQRGAMLVELRHKGYGGGYGGARPVALTSYEVRDPSGARAELRPADGTAPPRDGWDRLEASARSEAILLLRRLLDLEPSPPPLPEEPLRQ